MGIAFGGDEFDDAEDRGNAFWRVFLSRSYLSLVCESGYEVITFFFYFSIHPLSNRETLAGISHYGPSTKLLQTKA